MKREPKDKEAYSFLGVSLEEYRYQAVKIAEELHYSEEVIYAIRMADSETKITNILCDARNEL